MSSSESQPRFRDVSESWLLKAVSIVGVLTCSIRGEDTSDWLLTDKVSSWPGTSADRGWRYLRQSLERHDGPDTDYKYSKMTLETILAFDRSSAPPPWLIHSLEVCISLFICVGAEEAAQSLNAVYCRSSIRNTSFERVYGSKSSNPRWNTRWP